MYLAEECREISEMALCEIHFNRSVCEIPEKRKKENCWTYLMLCHLSPPSLKVAWKTKSYYTHMNGVQNGMKAMQNVNSSYCHSGHQVLKRNSLSCSCIK